MFYEIDSNLKKPLFNYPSLIKTIDTSRIHSHVSNWTHNIEFHPESKVDKEKINVVCCFILFKIFIENHATLNSFYINDNSKFLMMHVSNIILENPKFISEISYFGYHYSIL